jgi:hypothetical protein
MPFSEMSRRVALVKTGMSEGRIASIIRATRICGLRTLAVTSNLSTLRRNTVISEDGILHSHRRENQKSYIAFNFYM